MLKYDKRWLQRLECPHAWHMEDTHMHACMCVHTQNAQLYMCTPAALVPTHVCELSDVVIRIVVLDTCRSTYALNTCMHVCIFVYTCSYALTQAPIQMHLPTHLSLHMPYTCTNKDTHLHGSQFKYLDHPGKET